MTHSKHDAKTCSSTIIGPILRRKWQAGDSETGRRHLRELLKWTWKWRVVDWHIAACLLDMKDRTAQGLIARAREKKLIQAIAAPTRAACHVLTAAGAELIAEHMDPISRAVGAVTRRGEVSGQRAIHELLLQHCALRIERAGGIAHGLIRAAAAAASVDLSQWSDNDIAQQLKLYPTRYLGERGLHLRPAGQAPDGLLIMPLWVGDREDELRIAIEVQQSDETWSSPQQRWSSPPERKLSWYAEALTIGHDDAERQRRRLNGILYFGTRRTVLEPYQARWCGRLPSVSAEGRGDGRRYHAGGRDGTGPWRDRMEPLLQIHVAADLETLYYPGHRWVS
ncbi:hypothetical protein [Solimonas flava]|uniref:hypothetical protein n=1 Tax=Solimonas flava TaxID=415849 RepID=UPI00041E8CCF|nr:hypothetical protein [Solimonas flava]